jgi:hypothetical protein
MKSLLSFLTSLFDFKPMTEQDTINQYLSDSADLVDLENRIRMIDRNQAPWQIARSQQLSGWR